MIVTAGDVQAVMLRPLTEAELNACDGLIEQAYTKLQVRVPGIDQMIIGDNLKLAIATAAVVNAVKRVLMNPSMMRQVSRTAGPFTESGTYGETMSGGVEILDEDLAGLLPAVTFNLPSSVRLRSGYPRGW